MHTECGDIEEPLHEMEEAPCAEAGAVTEYMQSAFSHAEVAADVEIAVVKVCIPRPEDVSYIFSQLKKSQKYAEKGGVHHMH